MLTALGSLSFYALISYLYSSAVLGFVSFLMSMLIPIGAITRAGRDSAVLAQITHRGIEWEKARTHLRQQFVQVLPLSLVGACAFTIISTLNPNAGQVGYSVWHAALASGSIIFLNISYLMSFFFRAFGHTVQSCLQETGALFLISSMIVAFMAFVFDAHKMLSVSLAILVGSMLAAAYGALVLNARDRGNSATSNTESTPFDSGREFDRMRRSFAWSTAASVVQANSVMFVSGFFLTPADLGILAASVALSGALSFFLIVINIVAPRALAPAVQCMDVAQINEVCGKLSAQALALSTPLFAIALAFPALLGQALGVDFGVHKLPFFVILFSQFINVVTGPAGLLLKVTANHNILLTVSLYTTLLVLPAALYFVPVFGVTAAALAYLILSLSNNLSYAFFIKKELGFWLRPRVALAHR